MKIRQATFNDLESILALVKELAIYEKAPDEVWVGLEDYQQAFNDGVFEALVSESEQEVIGTCIYYLSWSTWKGRMLYLEDFIVRESFRRHGIGQQLFHAFVARAKELKCSLIKWQVLDWNTAALKFYERNEAIIEKDWWNGKIILGQDHSKPSANHFD